jgi:hypothetical protein
MQDSHSRDVILRGRLGKSEPRGLTVDSLGIPRGWLCATEVVALGSASVPIHFGPGFGRRDTMPVMWAGAPKASPDGLSGRVIP